MEEMNKMQAGIYWSEVHENYVIYGWGWCYLMDTYIPNVSRFMLGPTLYSNLNVCLEFRLLTFKALQLEWICEL